MDKSMDSGEKKEKEELKRFTIKNATDLQRVRLEKLMKNPAKEVVIPNRPTPKDISDTAPSFVRNVMGSSAGAGSGEFHVYRHLRRKEYARLKQIEEKGLTDRLNDQFQQKLDDNRKLAEEKTAKKRAKRLKKKQNQKKPKKVDQGEEVESESSADEEQEGDGDTGDDSKAADEKSDAVELKSAKGKDVEENVESVGT